MKQVVLILLLVALGFAQDTPEPDQAKNFGANYISIEEAKKLLDQGNVQFCDSRMTREFIMETIPTAVGCAYDEKGGKENKRADFDDSIESWNDSQIVDKNKTLIIFCNAKSCWKSYKAAVVATKRGYKDVRWLRDGIPAWKKAGFATENNCPL